MAKIDIEEIEAVLLEKKIDSNSVKDIIKRLSQILEDNKAEEEPKEKTANRFLVFEEAGELFLAQISEKYDAKMAEEDFRKAVSDHNANPRNKKKKIATVKDAFLMLKPRTLKNLRFKRKAKLSIEKVPISL